MKKITKMFFAMALIMCCAMSASAAKKVLLATDFEDGNVVFNGWGNNQTREVVEDGGSKVLKINNPSVMQSWEVQAAYDFSEAFLPNSEYTITMRIRGSEAGQISIGFQNPDGYASTGEFGSIDFAVDWTDVKVKCLCNGENGSRLIFSFGQFAGDIYIDDFEFSVYEEGPAIVDDGADDNLRWVNILTNSDLEGEADSSFIAVSNDPNKIDPETGGYIRGIAEITDGAGVDGSRGIMVKSFAGAAEDWDAQFWINLPEPLPAGTKFRVKFDYRASVEGSTADTQAHSTPSNYNHYDMIGSPTFSVDWQTYEREGTLSEQQSVNGNFQSVAFNLAKNRDEDVEFYFDNLTFELLNNGTVPQYWNQVILMDLGRASNIPALVAATGKSRLIYPEGCAVVTADGDEIPLVSVEAYADGRFYIFTDDILDEDVEVTVKFTNPTDPAYRIVYTDGDLSDMPDYDGIAYVNENVEIADALPNEFAAPIVLAIDPEDGSFNLPVDFKEIKVTFDKGVSCADLKAFLNTENLAVSPADGYAEVITLTRTSTAALAEGDYSISIEDIHSETGLDDTFWGEVRYSISIGHNVAENELVVDLANMLETAKQKRDANVDELYSGAAYNNLCAIIDQYDEEYKTLTAPSVYRSVTKEINNLIVEMDAHHNLVDTYYNTVRNAVSVVDQYSASKFASMPMFTQLKEDLAKYLDELQEPVKLYLDEELQAAVDALKSTVDNAATLFTEGPSKNDGTGTTGIAALTERLRLGAEALIKLGVSAEDELVVAAFNALEDDDNLAEQLKYRLKLELYNAINSGKDLFAQHMDEDLMEMVGDTYDMTVFFKNPNIYCNNAVGQETGFNPETTPGWSVPEGAGNPNVTTGWNAPAHVYVDCTFQNWGYAIGVEQTVVDLPAGIYNIKAGFGERDNAESGVGSYFYAKNSSVPAGEVIDSIGAPVIGQSFPNLNVEVKNVVVADGMLTVGVVGSATSHIFFNNISVQIAGLADFDYKKGYDDTKVAYDEYMTGIDGTVAAPAQVVGIQLFDLNGRRIMKAQQGIVILKKYMSDGTIQVEKVIKK